VAAWWSRAVIVYVGAFAVTAPWGLVTVVSKMLDDPAFARRDDLYALMKGSLLVGLFIIVALLLIDAMARLRRGTGLFRGVRGGAIHASSPTSGNLGSP
jgi:hypothetical protein